MVKFTTLPASTTRSPVPALTQENTQPPNVGGKQRLRQLIREGCRTDRYAATANEEHRSRGPEWVRRTQHRAEKDGVTKECCNTGHRYHFLLLQSRNARQGALAQALRYWSTQKRRTQSLVVRPISSKNVSGKPKCHISQLLHLLCASCTYVCRPPGVRKPHNSLEQSTRALGGEPRE